MGGRALSPLAAALCALALAAPVAAVAQDGVVRGQVKVFTRAKDGALVPKEDRSGVIVYLTGFDQPPPPEKPVVRQKFKTFIVAEQKAAGAHRSLAITRGQSVRFTNEDTILHNVFANSPAKRFDLGKKDSGEAEDVRFSQTGMVDIYCDIHQQMTMTILVLPNRAYAVTAADGSFELKGVPPGEHPLRAWIRWGQPGEARKVSAGQTNLVVEVVETEPQIDHLDKYGKPYDQRSQSYPQGPERK